MAEEKTETKYERAIREQWHAIVTALAIAFDGDREKAEQCLRVMVRNAFEYRKS
jgi:hypothetical protein